ncbi:NUDIX domain-containing protein [Kribbella solani]|uniref:NUDIX domain-containing protein n=1 Tax=Kribbella solani TaxID=236067 RepID=UPI0029BDF96B|nr:NUDIX domain-containing protein [Kribbella solani]MDX3000113.1 NUDIX domain-containing protein [Kribbella solani]
MPSPRLNAAPTSPDHRPLPVLRYTVGKKSVLFEVPQLRLGAVAAVLDGGRLLLTKRTDNGEWCLAGGAVEPGVRPAEAAEREAYEETGLSVRVTGLIGVYSNPDVLVVYPDGKRVQIVGVVFKAEVVAGEAGVRRR